MNLCIFSKPFFLINCFIFEEDESNSHVELADENGDDENSTSSVNLILPPETLEGNKIFNNKSKT